MKRESHKSTPFFFKLNPKYNTAHKETADFKNTHEELDFLKEVNKSYN